MTENTPFIEFITFSGYIGKTLLILAVFVPLSYCQINTSKLNHKLDMKSLDIELEIRKACIAERGTWLVSEDTCAFSVRSEGADTDTNALGSPGH